MQRTLARRHIARGGRLLCALLFTSLACEVDVGEIDVTATIDVAGEDFVLDAGQDQQVEPGSTVSLTARWTVAGVELPGIPDLTEEQAALVAYSWQQIEGTSVDLAGADSQTTTFTAPPTDAGPLVLGFRATALVGETEYSDEVRVTVVPDTGGTGQAPQVWNQSSATGRGQAVVLTLVGSDADDDDLTFSIEADPSHGALGAIDNSARASASLTYTPDADFEGTDSFTFRADDGAMVSDIGTFVVTVGDGLAVTDVSAATLQGESVTLTLQGSDARSNDLTFALVSPPEHGSLGPIDNAAPNSAVVTYTPDADFAGSDRFTFVATNGSSMSNTGQATVTVYPQVRFTVDPVEGPRDLTVTCSAHTTDGHPLPSGTYTWTFDGVPESGPTETHAVRTTTFTTAGEHTIALAVTLAGLSDPVAVESDTGEPTRHVYVRPIISGHVRDSGGIGIPSVTISASDGGEPTTTDGSGYYELQVRYNWSGVVTPELAGYSFDPPNRSYDGVDADIAGQGYAATPDDACPDDPDKTEPGVCGCGVPDTDSDGDGVPDCTDQFPSTLLSEDFDAYSAGDDPADWLDTAANNSMQQDDSLFQVFELGGEKVFGTTSSLTNIHSHYVGGDSDSWSAYEYSGRLMIDEASGGIGVTFLSDYPNTDSYYRLRRYNSGSFHIAPHGASISGGTTSTGVVPSPGVWYRFRIEVQDTGTQTEIRAKVWAAAEPEPVDWQVDCFDADSSRLTAGTIGLWSMGSGGKYWDDLEVSSLSCDADSDGDGVADCDDGCPSDPDKTAPGECGCGVADTDSDGDGVPDCDDQCPGAPDTDSDGDGVADCDDGCPSDPDKTAPGDCGCGVPDTDSDGDGTPDCLEPPTLCVSPTSLNFGSTTTTLTSQVWNCGTGTLDYTIDVAPCDDEPWPDGRVWLSVAPESGESSGEHDTITVTVDRTGLADDDYCGEITVTPSTGSAITIAVTMCVGTACATPPTAVLVASRTQGMVPLAIFFEATDSRDASGNAINSAGLLGNDILEYTWDFGAGSENDVGGRYFSGFNAAHVYETPGTYTVTLTVRTQDAQASATRTINAQPFSGTTYYVSGSQGSDSNDGLSPATPFATYAKGMSMLANRHSRKLLFKRGDTFTYTTPVHLGSATNVLIGAYGTGARPLIQYTGTGSHLSYAPIRGGTSEVAVVDIRFNCRSATGALADGTATGATNFLLLRVEIDKYHSMDRYGDLLFIVDSTLTDAERQNMYFNGSRLVLTDNTIGPVAIEHNLYGSVIDRGVITGTTFRSPGNGRHNMRIGANTARSGEVLLSHNEFDGAGTWLSIHMGVSRGGGSSFAAHNILFDGNRFHHAGTIIGNDNDGYTNIVIRNNIMEGGTALVLRDDSSVRVGTRALRFCNNTIVTGSTPAVKIETLDHESLGIRNNIFHITISSPGARAISVAGGIGEVSCDFNIFHLPNQGADPAAFQVGGTSYTLSQWRSTFGQDTNSLMTDPMFDPTSPSGLELLPGSPAIDSGWALWGVYEDFLSVRRPQRTGWDIGAFEKQ